MKNITSNELRITSIVIGIMSTLMILFPALVVANSNTSYTGIQIAFGYEFVNLGGFANGQIEFSFISIIAYLLLLIGSLLLIFNKKGYLISTILFAASAILLFLVPEFTVATVTAFGITNEISIDWTYGLGLIFSASLAIIGFIIGLFRIYKKV